MFRTLSEGRRMRGGYVDVWADVAAWVGMREERKGRIQMVDEGGRVGGERSRKDADEWWASGRWCCAGACYRVGDGERLTLKQKELVLAIYEVGQCFFHGWGVAKDQKMAVVSR